MALLAVAPLVAAAGWPCWAAAQATAQAGSGLAGFRVVADGIPDPLAGAQGDAERGRALIVARDAANCLLCHAIPDPAVRVAGNLGPSLVGVAGKLSVAQLRLRVADYAQVSLATAMPSYYRVDGLDRVAAAYRGKPILNAAQIEDIVAYLATLK